jgi:hypothetical protein
VDGCDPSISAIRAHQSGRAGTGDLSEASAVVDRFDQLSEGDKQDLLNFLRSL